MGRKFEELSFGPEDSEITVRTFEGGVKGKVSVFARLTGSGGAASLRVYGSFSGYDASGTSGGTPVSTVSDEVQTLDFGGIITADFWLGSLDISELGLTQNPEFVGQFLEPNTIVAPTAYNTSKTETYIPGNADFVPLASKTETYQPGNPADTTVGLPPIDEGENFTAEQNLKPDQGLPPLDDSEAFTTQVTTTISRIQEVPSNVTTNAAYRGYTPEQDFTLTFNGHTTSTIIASSDMTADIQAALVGLVDFDSGDVTVARTSATVYTLTFGGAYTDQDVSAVTITNVIGFTATGVTETNKGGTDTSGGSGSEEITDTATLANAISQVVGGQENKYPYLTFVFGGDADPGLTAEAYIVTY